MKKELCDGSISWSGKDIIKILKNIAAKELHCVVSSVGVIGKLSDVKFTKNFQGHKKSK
jgi:hypothetical protein